MDLPLDSLRVDLNTVDIANPLPDTRLSSIEINPSDPSSSSCQQKLQKRSTQPAPLRTVTASVRIILLIVAAWTALTSVQSGMAAPLAQDGDGSAGVELCYYADGPGRDITGQINDRPFSNHARVFKLRIDGVEQQAFCTDLHNPIGTKQCHKSSQIGVTDPLVACVLQNYPPQHITTNDEAAAVQGAIWHFSDGFEMSPDENIFGRYQSIIADVESKFAGGSCTPIDNWQLIVESDSPVHFLQPLEVGYRSGTHLLTIKVLAGEHPVPNQSLQVTTDLGRLNWQDRSGEQITVQTDDMGIAQVTLTHDQPGKANVEVTSTIELPEGTRVDPGPVVQKLVISGGDSFPLSERFTLEWVTGEKLVIKKFHDRNRDGQFNDNDEFVSWAVEICEVSKDHCFIRQLGDDGSNIFTVDQGGTYDICEISQGGWQPTTPSCQLAVNPPVTVWFSNVKVPALLIIKFHDLNGNGTRDPNEPGIEGWPFQIARQSGQEWVSTYSRNTGTDGLLGFSDIDFHTYKISEQFPAEGVWFASTPEEQTVQVGNRQFYTATFGNLQPSKLTIEKRWFVDSNPISPPEESPATICLQRTGPGNPSIPISPQVNGVDLMADEQGFFCFEHLLDSVVIEQLWPGTYQIVERSPESWTQLAIVDEVALQSSEHKESVHFINSTNTAALGDFVWLDTNQNGVQDSGESGVRAVTVSLFDGDGNQVETTDTDASGRYLFDDLLAGDYTLHFELPPDFQFSPKNQGNDVTIDSDVDGTTGRTNTVRLDAGQFDMTRDAGVFKPTAPSFGFEKYINGVDADSLAEAVRSEEDQILTFRYEVVNTGDVPLVWTTLFDDVFGDLSVECRLPIDVPVGRTEECTIIRLAGSFPEGKVNIATAQVAAEQGPLTPQEDVAWYVTIISPQAVPGFEFEKMINNFSADTVDKAVRSDIGQMLSFRYVVTNTGDTPLTWTVLNDDVFGNLSNECSLPITVSVGDVHSCTVLRPAGVFPDGKVNTGRATVAADGQILPVKEDQAWYITPSAPGNLASLGDYVWLDDNEDGIQNDAEVLAGIEVSLLDGDGVSLGMTSTTNESGFYLFDNLIPGPYQVEFSLPYGYTFTQPYRGGDIGIDSNASFLSAYVGRSEVIVLGEGEEILTVDAGLIFDPPELSVSKEVSVTAVQAGDLITYTIRYTNSGGTDALEVVIFERVPENTTLVVELSSPGWQCSSLQSGGDCQFSVGSIPAHTRREGTILFVVQVDDPLPPKVTNIVNTISVVDTFQGSPLGTGNPSAPVDLIVVPPLQITPDLEPRSKLVPYVYLPIVD